MLGWRVWLSVACIVAAVACSSTSTSSGPGPIASACDASACDAAAEDVATDDASIDAAPAPVDAARKLGPTLSGPNACGVCDRVWICNGFSQTWRSDGGNCVNAVNQTSLHCDGTVWGASGVGQVGEWKGDDQLLKLSFTGLNGESFIYACIPPPA